MDITQWWESTVSDNLWTDITMNVSSDTIETPKEAPVETAPVESEDIVQGSDLTKGTIEDSWNAKVINREVAAPVVKEEPKIDVAGLKRLVESKKTQEEEVAPVEVEEEKPATVKYNDSVMTRIRRIHNWVTWDQWTSIQTWAVKKEKDQYINDSWKWIDPAKYTQSLKDNMVLSTFIKDTQQELEMFDDMKSLVETLQEQIKIQSSVPESHSLFLETMDKFDGWDSDAGWEVVEQMWTILDRVIPGMAWKFYQFLNTAAASPSKVETQKKVVEKKDKQELLNRVTKSMFQ